MNNKEEFISLFDFLGKPAGGELGKKVFEEAKKQKQRTSIKQIETKNYTGNIVLYKREFLDEYFKPKKKPYFGPSDNIVDPDELPF